MVGNIRPHTAQTRRSLEWKERLWSVVVAEVAGRGGGGGAATAAVAISKEAAKTAISWELPVKSMVEGASRLSASPCEGKEGGGTGASVFP